MNVKAVKKHILERLAHGEAIQVILNPQPPMVKHTIGGETVFVPDPDWVKPDLPDWNLVIQWMKDDEGFRVDYEQSFKYGGMYLADYMLVLKDELLKNPKAAPAYKAAMEMVRMSAMWRDSKYSERTINEVKNTTPQDAEHVLAGIKEITSQLSEYFEKAGVDVNKFLDMGSAVEVAGEKRLAAPTAPKKNVWTEERRAKASINLAKARAAIKKKPKK